jgi:2-methylcitrate dehydratase PrpD
MLYSIQSLTCILHRDPPMAHSASRRDRRLSTPAHYTPLDDAVAAAFATWSCELDWNALEPRVQQALRAELLDFAGDMIAGRSAVGMPAWLEVLLDDSARHTGTVIGGQRAAPWTAALANGYFGHVLELDDTHDEAVLHAGAAVIPAAIAAAELRGDVSGATLLEAILAGIELTCRLGVATDLSLVEGGWIYTALLGHFGAALAAAHVLNLDVSARRSALGVVYCFASGNHQSSREGAITKHLQPGIAAGNGLKAALMASRGLGAVQAPFDGEDGFARVYLRGRFDPGRALRGLGVEYEAARLSIKPYPSCRLTHPAISAALRLREQLGENLPRVEAVRVRMGTQAHDVVGRDVGFRRHPARWLDAQFSVFWTVAVALCHGAVHPGHLLEEVPPGAELRGWIERIEAVPMRGSAVRDVGACEIEARGAFGCVQARASAAKGHPDAPLTDAELTEKFCANVALAAMSRNDAQALARALVDLDRAAGVDALLDALRRPQARTALTRA